MAEQGLSAGGEGIPNAEQAAQQSEKAQEMMEQRATLLAAVLTAEARQRLHRVEMVKPDKAARVENAIIQMAQQRKLQGKVTEESLITLLEQYDQDVGTGRPKVTIRRRPTLDASDSDESDGSW